MWDGERLQTSGRSAPWRRCAVCVEPVLFKAARDFSRHLREFHCSKEGGSFVCRYGPHGVCPSLPVEGVSDQDYEDHVTRDHVAPGDTGSRRSSERSPAGSREGSVCSTPVQSEPSVVQDQHKWTIFSSRVNLPAVLNDPRLGRQSDFFSKTWGDSFEKAHVYPSPHLLDINYIHFKRYLDKTSKRHRRHVRHSESLAPVPEPSLPVDAFPILLTRRKDRTNSELENVPKLFLQNNFNLENPETFNTVFPWTQVEASKPDTRGKPHQSSKLLQEKLSHYLDVVEVQIARQISQRSEAFFHAMSSHDALKEHLSWTCSAVKQLREKISSLDQTLVEGPMRIMSLHNTRKSYVQVYNKLKMMSTVHQTQPTIQLLLSTSEFVGALDLISTTQEVLQQELAGIHSFRHLGSQLAEMEKLIDRMMQDDFVRYISTDLNRPIEEIGHVEEERLVAIVMGMMRQQKFQFVDVYREEACTAVKAVIKQTVIEAVSAAEDIENDNNVTSLADQMRLLNYSTWMELLQTVFSNLLVILSRVKAVSKIVQEVALLASGQTSPPSVDGDELRNAENEPHVRLPVGNEPDNLISQVDYVKLTASLKETLCSVCDQAHDRCVKLLVARGKDGFLGRLSSSEFVTLSRTIEGFVTDCEQLSGRKSTSLRGTLQSQANKFVNRFHEERKTKLSLILDNERWKQSDVPAEFQDLVDRISETGVLAVSEKKADPGRQPGEVLFVNGQKYAVVGTVLILLNMVVDYCQCVSDIPSVSPDILTRLVELLKTFNSRTCQLILGAGALQLVGLKTISTKNLALASRCLQLVLYFLPTVQQHFEDRLQEKQQHLIKHFEHVLKDYNDHIAEINNKLVSIMEQMIDAQLIKWEVKAPMPSACFRGICKQMSKFHEACSDLLPHEQIKDLFIRINGTFLAHVRTHLVRIGLTNDGGPQHGLVTSDLAFYCGSLSSLPGLKQVEVSTENVWQRR